MRKAKSFMVKNTDFKVKMHGFEYQLYSFPNFEFEKLFKLAVPQFYYL